MNFEQNWLALAALGGVIAGFWNHVKTVIAQFYSLGIVKVNLDANLSREVRLFLYSQWTLAPSSQIVYVSRWFAFKNRPDTVMVPFKIPGAELAIYFKGLKFIFNSHHDTFTFIRGTVNMENLIKDSIEFSLMLKKENPIIKTRYSVVKVMGSEKGMSAFAEFARSGITERSTRSTPEPEGDAVGSRFNDSIDIRIHRSFMYEARDYLEAANENPLGHLYYDDKVLSYFEEARTWLSKGQWYSDHGIPHRRGWLLTGPGGTGKSSMAKAVAQDLKIPIYSFYMSTLSDQEFIREWSCLQAPCVVLFEDFDTVFNKRIPLTEHKTLTFDCVLNQISGVDTMNGVLLIVTTNHPENIDEAMGVSFSEGGISTRPGRIDAVIELGAISDKNKRAMATKILGEWPESIDKVICESPGYTPVQFQEACLQQAFLNLGNEKKNGKVKSSDEDWNNF